jgi:sigma-B regulation protein RsbU (phosphoserine phosphatase)
MAMSRTLIRTYAMEFAAQPQAAIQATNKRLLQDARVNLFVTLFYGVLDSSTGILTYVNAGHNPPYWLRFIENGDATPLEKTGIPIGIDEDTQWEQHTIQITPGDVLLLYTDGITESQNDEGESFDEDFLVETAVSQFGQTAHDIQAAILESVQNFVGDNPQSDDIALMVLSRDWG